MKRKAEFQLAPANQTKQLRASTVAQRCSALPTPAAPIFKARTPAQIAATASNFAKSRKPTKANLRKQRARARVLLENHKPVDCHLQKQSPLFGTLPAELRNFVFDLVLSPYHDTTRSYCSCSLYHTPETPAPQCIKLALLLTCRLAYKEAGPIVPKITFNVLSTQTGYHSRKESTGNCGGRCTNLRNRFEKMLVKTQREVQSLHFFFRVWEVGRIKSFLRHALPMGIDLRRLIITHGPVSWTGWRNHPPEQGEFWKRYGWLSQQSPKQNWRLPHSLEEFTLVLETEQRWHSALLRIATEVQTCRRIDTLNGELELVGPATYSTREGRHLTIDAQKRTLGDTDADASSSPGNRYVNQSRPVPEVKYKDIYENITYATFRLVWRQISNSTPQRNALAGSAELKSASAPALLRRKDLPPGSFP